MSERVHRSIVKSISWRLTGTLDTILISYLITRQAKFAFSIGCVELFTKCLLYFLHERAWNRVRFGRATSPRAGIACPTCARPTVDPVGLTKGSVPA
ncbi:MAG: DUF2061 domain-containing protein [Acidobacteriota bacterium]